MDIRNEWVSKPATPERLAEAMVRSFFAVVIYVVTLVIVVVWAGASTDWFAGFGLLVPLFWLLDWMLPASDCEMD